MSLQLCRGKLCFPEAEDSEFFLFSSVCSSLGAGSCTCGESGPTAPAALLSVSKLCLVQTEFVCFFEAVQSCSGESERLQLFGTSPGSEAASTPAWHQTHSSTLRSLFCSVAGGSRSNQTHEQPWTQSTTKKHHIVPLKSDSSSSSKISHLSPFDLLGFQKIQVICLLKREFLKAADTQPHAAGLRLSTSHPPSM